VFKLEQLLRLHRYHVTRELYFPAKFNNFLRPIRSHMFKDGEPTSELQASYKGLLLRLKGAASGSLQASEWTEENG